MKWLIKITLEIFVKTAIVVSGFSMIFYSVIVSKQWSRFDFFVFLFGVFGAFILIALFTRKLLIKLILKLPKFIKIAALAIICAGVASFIIVESIIISNMFDNSAAIENEADYVIVPGCQVVGIYLSVPLIRRVNTAVDYLNKHPNTKVIVTGGQGPGENITEAEAMRRYLTEKQIDKDRILMEDKARNTKQNFQFSNELYDLTEKKIVIVTTDYHIFRSKAIAKKLGCKNILTLPSKSQKEVLPMYLFREYFAVVLYALTGRI